MPDQQRVVQIEAVDQVEIEIGDVVDAAEPGGARRIAEAGVAGRYDPEALCEAVEERPVLHDIVAAVQEQEGRAGADDLRLDRDAGDVDAFHASLSAPSPSHRECDGPLPLPHCGRGAFSCGVELTEKSPGGPPRAAI